MYELEEHWTNWTARKSHRTHFSRPGTSSPKNNSTGLYDGSAEARAILVDAMNFADEDPGLSVGYEMLESALNYFKGKDLSPERFSYTADFFGPTPEEWVEQLMAEPGSTPLVQIEESLKEPEEKRKS